MTNGSRGLSIMQAERGVLEEDKSQPVQDWAEGHVLPKGQLQDFGADTHGLGRAIKIVYFEILNRAHELCRGAAAAGEAHPPCTLQDVVGKAIRELARHLCKEGQSIAALSRDTSLETPTAFQYRVWRWSSYSNRYTEQESQ
ncbi:hypothetical protein WJX73_003825 [Symbiochloris irregularis]|uniref:Uncharacterized protein n=1 Tax=Symbiochloris irregularis TaxID=706552 RepID=A0AAW1P6F4_9CHLO